MARLISRRTMIASAAPAALAAACGAPSGPQVGQAGEGAIKSRVTVTLWDRTDTNYQAYVDTWMKGFNDQHEKVTVRYEPRPDDWGEKLTAAMVAGTPPDVVAVFGHWFRAYQQQGQALPLDKYIKASSFDAGDFLQGVYKGMNWQGQQIGIPQYVNTNTMYYNRNLFQQAGIAFPAKDWTHDQLLDYAQRLTRGPVTQREVWGLSLGWSGITGRAASLLWGQGGNYNDPKDPSIFHFHTPANLGAFQWVHDLPWKYHIGDRNSQERGGVGRTTAFFSNGAIAMILDGTHLLSSWKDKAQIDWDVATLPKGPGGRGERSSMDGYIVPAGVKSPDAAWVLVRAITDKEANRMRAEMTGLAPARKSQFEFWTQTLPSKSLKNAVPTDAARPDPDALWPQAAEVVAAVDPVMDALFDRNELSVPAALKQADDAVIGVLGPAAVRPPR